MNKSISKDTYLCSLRFPRRFRDVYERMYPGTLQKFLRRCINLALDDENFFKSVFFNPKFSDIIELSDRFRTQLGD